MARKKTNEIPFNRMPFNNEFLSNLVAFSPSQVLRVIKTFVSKSSKQNNFLDYWDPACTAVPMLLIIGDKGIGKSSIVKFAAQQLEYELRRVMTGDAEAQDLMGVVDPLANNEDDDNPKYNKYRFANCIPFDPPKGNGEGGILLVDDIGGLDSKQQKVLRALVTEGYSTGWYGEILAPGWNWIATSNPEDASYFLVNEIEESLRDRMIPIVMRYDAKEIIHFLASGGRIPDTIHKFLLMDKGAISAVTPRGWEYIGGLTYRFESGHDLSRAEFINLMRGKMPPGTVESFNRFLEKGNDPTQYPLLAKEIMGASDTEHKVHIKRMRLWSRNGSEALLGATAYDMAAVLGDSDIKCSEEQIIRIADIIEQISKTDLVQVILDSTIKPGNQNKADWLVSHFRSGDIAERLGNMMDRRTERNQKTS